MKLKIKTLALAVITFTTPFLLSYKAIAVDMTQLVQYIGTWDITHNPTGSGSCNANYQAGNSTVSAFWYVSNSSSSSPCSWNDSVLSLGGLGFNDKYIFQVDYYLYDYRDKEEINSYANQPPTLRMDNGRFPLNYIGADYKMMDNDSAVISYYFNIPYTNTLNIGDNFRIITNIGLQVNETIAMSNKMTIWSYYQAVGGNGTSGNYTQIINAINTVNNTIDSWSNTQTQRLDSILQIINNNNESIQNINNNLQDSVDNTQQASQEGQNNADNGQTTTEQASSNIIGIIGNVVGAFNTNARSNCQLNMNLGNIDFGRVDFCSGKPSAWQQILGGAMSIVLVYVVYRVAKNVFNIFMSAMVFAQGGDRKDG